MKILVTTFLLLVTSFIYSQDTIPCIGCICPKPVVKLDPEKCSPVLKDYGTEAIVPIKWTARVELLTYRPSSRPEGFRAIKIAFTEEFGGYIAVCFGNYETKGEAEDAVHQIRNQYPEFCKAFVWQVPKFDEQYRYVERQTIYTEKRSQP